MNEDGLTIEEALSNLYRLTDCRCDPEYRVVSQHERGCVSDYRMDVEAVAEALGK